MVEQCGRWGLALAPGLVSMESVLLAATRSADPASPDRTALLTRRVNASTARHLRARAASVDLLRHLDRWTYLEQPPSVTPQYTPTPRSSWYPSVTRQHPPTPLRHRPPSCHLRDLRANRVFPSNSVTRSQLASLKCPQNVAAFAAAHQIRAALWLMSLNQSITRSAATFLIWAA